MEKIAEFCIRRLCPSNLAFEFEQFEIKNCEDNESDEQCRECWERVEEHLKKES